MRELRNVFLSQRRISTKEENSVRNSTRKIGTSRVTGGKWVQTPIPRRRDRQKRRKTLACGQSGNFIVMRTDGVTPCLQSFMWEEPKECDLCDIMWLCSNHVAGTLYPLKRVPFIKHSLWACHQPKNFTLLSRKGDHPHNIQ